jgi:hypothetical protein
MMARSTHHDVTAPVLSLDFFRQPRTHARTTIETPDLPHCAAAFFDEFRDRN